MTATEPDPAGTPDPATAPSSSGTPGPGGTPGLPSTPGPGGTSTPTDTPAPTGSPDPATATGSSGTPGPASTSGPGGTSSPTSTSSGSPGPATARETILARIRDAQALASAPEVTIPRDYRTGRTLPTDELLELLTDRLVDYKAEVHACPAADTAQVLAAVLRDHGARRVGVPPGLDPSWLTAYDGEVRRDSADVPAPELDALDGVVTASAVTCAETGTIFLDASPDQGRRALTLVPDLHVCVVDRSTVEAGVPETVARLAPTRPTTLISGPSATSDIELERVEGVHGPRTLVVVIRTDA